MDIFDMTHSSGSDHGILTVLESYWRDLRGANRLPVRNSVDPARIDAALPSAFILDRVAPGVARMRVAGQRINDLLGMDGRGMLFSSLFSPAAAQDISRLLDQVFDGPAIVSLPVVSHRSLTRSRMTGQILVLPLAGTDGGVARALGALVTDSAPGRSARRFDIAPGEIRVEGLDHPDTRLRLAATSGAPLRIGPAVARPALKLVVSND